MIEFLSHYLLVRLPLSRLHVLQNLVAARWQQLLQDHTLTIPSSTDIELLFPSTINLSPESDTHWVSEDSGESGWVSWVIPELITMPRAWNVMLV